VQGYDNDDSDDEWEEHIAAESRQYDVPENCPRYDERDGEVDVAGVVEDHFNMYDAARTAAMEESAVEAPELPRAAAGCQGQDFRVELPPTPAYENPDEANYMFLREEAMIPLFNRSCLSSLSATMLIMNCCRTHNVPSIFVSELLSLLGNSVLPQPNTLPTTEHVASTRLANLGLPYDSIHVCPNNCTLFRKENADLDACPKSNAPRMKRVGQSWVPFKVLRHFPIIPRIQRMFGSVAQAKEMVWYSLHLSTDGRVRHCADSLQWKDADRKNPGFAAGGRNVRLVLATDGMNPHSEKRSTYSVWPVEILNYNIAPWLATKPYWMMLSLIIPGPKAVSEQKFDVFLQPLLDELLELWNPGVQTKDAARQHNEEFFVLRAMLLFTIHDFPGYGLVAGCTTKGAKGCPICGKNTKTQILKKKYLWPCTSEVAR
jgi:hypothetical protein